MPTSKLCSLPITDPPSPLHEFASGRTGQITPTSPARRFTPATFEIQFKM